MNEVDQLTLLAWVRARQMQPRGRISTKRLLQVIRHATYELLQNQAWHTLCRSFALVKAQAVSFHVIHSYPEPARN